MKPSFLVTAGPTRERIDPVRFISNYSTGTFGYIIAKEAAKRGFKTTLISGPTHIEPPSGCGIRFIRVESALEMLEAVKREFRTHTCLIMSAAVSDWRVAAPSGFKIKRKTSPLILKLIPNPDILSEIGTGKGSKIIVGFALETDNMVGHATKKLREKNLDIIVANELSVKSNVFGAVRTNIAIIDRNGGVKTYVGKTKGSLAKIILDKVLSFNI